MADLDAIAYVQHATIHGDRIVFAAEGNLWEVGLAGGVARRLTSSTATQQFPHFSPDGAWLAFSSADEGQSAVYVMPSAGGEARRLTYHATADEVAGWTPDGARVVFRTMALAGIRARTLATVPARGGAARLEPFGRADGIAWHGDGDRVALARHFSDPAWWKRYAGGRAGRIWLGSLSTGDFTRLPGGPRTDCCPMWIGDALWFLSDQDGMGDLWVADAQGRRRRRVTHHTELYARRPQTDGRHIVYTMGGRLFLLDPLARRPKPREVPVEARGHSLTTRRRFVDVPRSLEDYGTNRDGSELALTVRGRIVRLPCWHGAARVVGDLPGTRFRGARWLDDDTLVAIAHADDADQVVTLPAAGGPLRTLGGVGRRIRALEPSPDGKHVAVLDHGRGLHVMALADGATRLIDDQGGLWVADAAWSPCSTWLAWTRRLDWRRSEVLLARADGGEPVRVGDRQFADFAPAWDPAGRYLAFLSNRHLNPYYDQLQHDFGFPATTIACAVALRPGEGLPFSADTRPPKEEPKRVTQPIAIEPAGLSGRVGRIPFVPGRYLRIGCALNAVAVLQLPLRGALDVPDARTAPPPTDRSVLRYDLAERKVDTALSGVTDWRPSADGTRWAYRLGRDLRVVDAAAKPADDEKDARKRRYTAKTGWVDLRRVAVSVEPRAEYRQIFHEAWRLQLDHFYDPALAQVDWAAQREKYLPLVDRVRTREELIDLLWEMQGELGTSHAYAFGGDLPQARRYRPGQLGCDFGQDTDGSWYISRIYPGDPWADKKHSPLVEPGREVAEGARLLAVDGHPVDADHHPGEWLLEMADRPVVLSIAEPGREPREVTVTPLGDDGYLRYRAWVDANRQLVAERTVGRVAYVHIPNMSTDGAVEFHRSLLWQLEGAEAFIIDNRFNGGGNISGILLEKLLRRPIGWVQSRWGRPDTYPRDSLRGPVVVLTNENAGSDGDIFSQAVKATGLGPLIGMRTWGGVVGIDTAKDLVDRGYTSQPEYAYWFPEVRWGVENRGVEPDIEVDRTPADALRGVDPQLDRAIEEVSRLLAAAPKQPPDLGPMPDLRFPPAGPGEV